MEHEDTFFDFAAEVGLTKHIGGIDATEAITALCHIGAGMTVLDVGCGVGVTPCFIVRKYNCQVIGVDILERMVERSQERAKKEGLSDRVDFKVADAQDLPFKNDLFDAVITESVTAFPKDKQKAVNEYARVTKPGGYIGLNESTWLKSPVPPEFLGWVSQEIGSTATPLTSKEWINLLENAGVKDISAETHKIDIRKESKNIVKRYGFGGAMKVIGRMLRLYTRNPAYREFVKEVQKQGVTPKNLDEYFGYGLYVGRK